MTTLTVWGPLADATGMASPSEQVPGPYGHWTRREYISAPSFRYRRTQARVPVRVNHHGPELGRVEFLSLWPCKQLIATAVIDLPDTVSDRDDNAGATALFWSPTIRRAADGTIDLLEVSATRRPASLGLRPIRTLAGSLLRRSARRSWTLPSNRIERMLEDAAASAQHGGPIEIALSPANPQLTRAASPPVTPHATSTLPHSRRLRNVNHPEGLWISKPMRDSIISVR